MPEELRLHPRVSREDDRDMTGQLLERSQIVHQGARVVDVGRAMEGQDHVRLTVEPELARDRRSFPARPGGLQGVDHDVADEVDFLGRDALPEEVRSAALLRDEQEVRDGVRQEPVDLLGHTPVEGTEPGLDVGDGDVKLHRREGGGQRGVHVAHDQHEVGQRGVQDRLEAAHDLGGLDRVRARADAEVEVGGPDIQVLEEPLRHRPVVVLAGVDEDRSQGRLRAHRPDEWGPDDVDDPHRALASRPAVLMGFISVRLRAGRRTAAPGSPRRRRCPGPHRDGRRQECVPPFSRPDCPAAR